MNFIRYIILYVTVEFLLCWSLSVISILLFEPKSQVIREALIVGAAIQFRQIFMRLFSLSYLTLSFTNIKLKINGHHRKTMITSALMLSHIIILSLLAVIFSDAEDIIFGSVSMWLPIFSGVFLTPYVIHRMKSAR